MAEKPIDLSSVLRPALSHQHAAFLAPSIGVLPENVVFMELHGVSGWLDMEEVPNEVLRLLAQVDVRAAAVLELRTRNLVQGLYGDLNH